VIVDRPFAAKVEAMAGYGITLAEIAIVLGTDEASVERDYAAELASGQIKANARVAENLFRKATSDGREAVTAAIFWLKTRARWREASPRDDAPALTRDFSNWSDEELEAAITVVDGQIRQARRLQQPEPPKSTSSLATTHAGE